MIDFEGVYLEKNVLYCIVEEMRGSDRKEPSVLVNFVQDLKNAYTFTLNTV